MRAWNLRLLAVLCGALLALAGCDSDDSPTPTPGPGTDVPVTGDADAGGGGEDADDNDSGPADDTTDSGGGGEDIPYVACENRECGSDPVTGELCGQCPPGEVCGLAGQCEIEKLANGSFCGPTATCSPTIPDPFNPGAEIDNPDYPDCVHQSCQGGFCLGYGAPGVLVFGKDACTQPCEIYKDEVNNVTGQPGADGVEDADTPFSDCDGFIDGPMGAGEGGWACVNFADPGGQTLAYCLPGSNFATCDSDADCAADEGCTITTLGDPVGSRCVKKMTSGEWGEAVGVSGACNGDPADGDLSFCASGLCYGLGCVTMCQEDSHCDTTGGDPEQGCDTSTGFCKVWPTEACTVDTDCSAWECSFEGAIFSDLPDYTPLSCWPKGCDTDVDCHPDYYCRFQWNGEPYPDAALDNLCFRKSEGGALLGEACDPDPSDNIPGATCENEDLCVGGYCSAMCTADEECGDSQVCSLVELPGDYDDDGTNDFALAFGWCTTLINPTVDCLSNITCGDGQYCDIYTVEKITEGMSEVCEGEGSCVGYAEGTAEVLGTCADDASVACTTADDCGEGECEGYVAAVEAVMGACGSGDACMADSDCCEMVAGEVGVDPDSPHTIVGKCVDSSTESGDWGNLCGVTGAEFPNCNGFCLGADSDANQAGYCTHVCESAADCPDVTIGGTEYKGRCSALLYGWGGDIVNPNTNTYVSLCLVNGADSSLEDCSETFTCPAGEGCLPYVVNFSPDYPAKTEYLCQNLENVDETVPTKQLGEACDPDAETPDGFALNECVDGLCFEDSETGQGYCSKTCSPDSDTCAADSGNPTMACLEVVTQPKQGAYTEWSGGFFACRKDIDCTPCFNSGFCPGDRVCANLGQDDDTLSDYRCVPSCATDDDCADQEATTCTEGLDGNGQMVMGCFEQGANFPVNYCTE